MHDTTSIDMRRRWISKILGHIRPHRFGNFRIHRSRCIVVQIDGIRRRRSREERIHKNGYKQTKCVNRPPSFAEASQFLNPLYSWEIGWQGQPMFHLLLRSIGESSSRIYEHCSPCHFKVPIRYIQLGQYIFASTWSWFFTQGGQDWRK